MPTVSIVIPTLDRRDCLRDCLESLWHQTYEDYEIIKVTEEGPLAKLRNEGAKRSRGKYLVFIDDDVACSPGWLQGIVTAFDKGPSIGGVSGVSAITKKYRANRDLFRHHLLKWLYDQVFLGRQQHLPGHFTEAGAWTTGAANETCDFEGPVQFLEACNMAYRRDVFFDMGGFDDSYLGVGDWSEPDLAFRIREAGYSLWFSRDARLEHRPSKSGAFKKRRSDARNRMANYELFASRWIKPHWKHTLYKQFMKTYYAVQRA